MSTYSSYLTGVQLDSAPGCGRPPAETGAHRAGTRAVDSGFRAGDISVVAPENPYGKRDRTVASDIPTHRVAISSMYQFPIGKGRRSLSDANCLLELIFGGWELSTMYEYYSGQFLSTSLDPAGPHGNGVHHQPHRSERCQTSHLCILYGPHVNNISTATRRRQAGGSRATRGFPPGLLTPPGGNLPGLPWLPAGSVPVREQRPGLEDWLQPCKLHGVV